MSKKEDFVLWKDIDIENDLDIKVGNFVGSDHWNEGIYVLNKKANEMLQFILPPMEIVFPQLYPYGNAENMRQYGEDNKKNLDSNQIRYKAIFKSLNNDDDIFEWLKKLEKWIIEKMYKKENTECATKKQIQTWVDKEYVNENIQEKEDIMKKEYLSRWNSNIKIDNENPRNSYLKWSRIVYSKTIPSFSYIANEFNNYNTLLDITKMELDTYEIEYMKKNNIKYKHIVPIYDNQDFILLTLKNRQKYNIHSGDIVSIKTKCRKYSYADVNQNIKGGIVFEPVWIQIVKRNNSKKVDIQSIKVPMWNISHDINDDNNENIEDNCVKCKRIL